MSLLALSLYMPPFSSTLLPAYGSILSTLRIQRGVMARKAGRRSSPALPALDTGRARPCGQQASKSFMIHINQHIHHRITIFTNQI